MKRYTLLLTLIILVFTSSPQAKKILDHDDYDIWYNINNKGLNSTGTWLWYNASPDEKDGYLKLRDINKKTDHEFERGDSLNFSRDGQIAVFLKRCPKKLIDQTKEDKTISVPDSLRIFFTHKHELLKFGDVKTYTLAKEASNFSTTKMTQ